jgi:TPP-dependent pyruvate/acetoin dehydrogenase alpha subunit
VLLEMALTRFQPHIEEEQADKEHDNFYSVSDGEDDPLLRCQGILQRRGAWDDAWAEQLTQRIRSEVERAMQDALRDTTFVGIGDPPQWGGNTHPAIDRLPAQFIGRGEEWIDPSPDQSATDG